MCTAGHGLKDAVYFGWGLPDGDTPHDWGKMVTNIQNHIGSLNWGYRQALSDKNVKYLNGLASFVDPHTIKVQQHQHLCEVTLCLYLAMTGSGAVGHDRLGGRGAVGHDRLGTVP